MLALMSNLLDASRVIVLVLSFIVIRVSPEFKLTSPILTISVDPSFVTVITLPACPLIVIGLLASIVRLPVNSRVEPLKLKFCSAFNVLLPFAVIILLLNLEIDQKI